MKTVSTFFYFLTAMVLIGKISFSQTTENYCKQHKIKSTNNISRIMASASLNDYDIGYVFLNLSLETTDTYIQGSATLKIKIKATTTDTIVYELLQDLTVDSIKVNGVTTTFTHANDLIKINALGLVAGQIITTQVYYHGTSPTGGFFSGLSSQASQRWGNRATWSLSESFHARDWWPSKQVLSDRIDSSDVWITTSNENKAGSNGILQNITAMPNNKVRYEWHNNQNINYYLISIVTAKYIEYNTYAHPTGIQDSVLIQNYIYDNPQTLPAFKSSIDKTGRYIEVFSDLFGLYPYWKQKYGHSMAPFSGGEEHQTMTTIGVFSDDIVAHELGHQWWGDHITCGTWQDIFINEGFAGYCEVLALEKTSTQQNVVSKLNSVHSNVMSSPDGSVYIPFASATDENRIFDSRLTYDKGSSIIHMMRFEAQNDSLFFVALKKMQTTFKDSVAIGDDLKNVLEQVTGKSYQTFFDQWYYGEGYPSYQFDWYTENDTLTINSKQTTSTTVTPLFKMLMDFYVTTNNGVVNFKPRQENSTEVFKMPLNGSTVSAINFNKNQWLLAKQTRLTHLTTGLKNNFAQQSIIYPNPAQNFITIQSEALLTSYKITDLQGRLIKSDTLKNKQVVISLDSVNSGIYFITLVSDNATSETHKLVIE
ncbi:MAG: T9SS type A sorting domain-containing protein [Bacteroidia bacterium]|nr:T9SS type A sorting domain-containing protein [Bacteroidia bacterium]